MGTKPGSERRTNRPRPQGLYQDEVTDIAEHRRGIADGRSQASRSLVTASDPANKSLPVDFVTDLVDRGAEPLA